MGIGLKNLRYLLITRLKKKNLRDSAYPFKKKML